MGTELQALALASAGESAWRDDHEAFLRHFDLGYEDFMELVLALPADKSARYHKLLELDEEAAITWVIAEGKRLGLLQPLE